MSPELEARVEKLRSDYTEVMGQPFACFFCPILHRDEDTALCMGHVVPDSCNSSREWVPQRCDVDHFYGSLVEADFSDLACQRLKDPVKVWLDPNLRRRHQPQLEFEGEPIETYFTKGHHPVTNHTPVVIVGEGGQTFGNVNIKTSPNKAFAWHGKQLEVALERSYAPEAIASLLKAAHLTLFSLLGYRYVFSTPGCDLAQILRTFFEQHHTSPRDAQRVALASYFNPLSTMAVPILKVHESFLKGTITDGRVLIFVGSTGAPFTSGVIVKAGQMTCCVCIPGDDATGVGTYFGFLKNPPDAVHAKMLEFRNQSWHTDTGEPFCIPFAPKLQPG